ncbi:probable L-type lectin-domain containing receptor kinase S.5 [Amaranthus tricolor]|uniref:probable L-type lectin-domain containing receptor kinase S.5 n=1 Tax=Amaranthus tricolor TaxID=29722 RepID=UPI002583CD61|nr:probable L-type lectin-domain containing receptor kinase S.5 [Amaranthus tricolor]
MAQSCRFLVLTLLVSFGALNCASCLNLTYPDFSEEYKGDFKDKGNSAIVKEALQVTYDLNDDTLLTDLSGRILYKNPVRLWKKKQVASFNSTFVFNVSPVKNRVGAPGDGLAFILTEEMEVPHNSMGQWLGIVNVSTNGSSHRSIVAIEFDTKKSFPDDLDNNHVGLNINSINSRNKASLNSTGITIASERNLTAMILYDGVKKTMNISVFKGHFVLADPPVLSISDIDLSKYLVGKVYVGFSASTGAVSVERNCVLEWYFSIDDIGEDPKIPIWGWIIISVSIVFALCGVLGGWLFFCYKRKPKLDGHDLPIISGVGPKKFKLKDLKGATGNFSENRELGRGAFGIVYKGTVEGRLVAVKRIKNTPKGLQNLVAEVTTIGSLHHKNLVELIGWCYEDRELLLVYEYMHNRSLDTLLYGEDGKLSEAKPTQDTTLSWKKRYNVICGVAQALDYLHNECLKRVLHRDIKASNILLDSDFNARLGDFGLARMFKREKTHYSTKEIAGTPGYMAPELFLTGKATTETDVFAFGVLALVVASGRKPGSQNEDDESIQNIIDWVWQHYSMGTISNAIDPKLKGNCDERQAKCMLLLGLACCNPNPNLRPSMGYVMQVLIGEASLPQVPFEKPAFVWPAPSPSFTHEDSSSGGVLSIITTLDGR